MHEYHTHTHTLYIYMYIPSGATLNRTWWVRVRPGGLSKIKHVYLWLLMDGEAEMEALAIW